VIGLEHQLTNRIALQARYVHKQLDRGSTTSGSSMRRQRDLLDR